METCSVYKGTRQQSKKARVLSSPSEAEERSEQSGQSSGRDNQPGLTRRYTHPRPRSSAVTERMPHMFGWGQGPAATMQGSEGPTGTADVSHGVETGAVSYSLTTFF